MGKWKAMIPILLALVVAFTVSFFLYRWLQTQTAPKEEIEVKSEALPIAVATADYPWGTKLTPEMIETVPFLKESLPTGHFSDPGLVTGRILITSLMKNEPITESKLAPTDVTTGGVAAVVAPGKRAVAVKGDKVIGLSGFISPGNRVDVLVTMTNPKTKLEVTKIVLENILVLATGEKIEKNDKGDPAPVDVYTLEVTPEEGERLGLAATQGKLQFALRNITDAETVLTPGATITGTLSSYGIPKPVYKPRKYRTSSYVEVIKGNESKTEKF